ncbi:3'(2'),5'-bisphosphate nucleotidase CysQ [Gordonia pseudamarae]|jgi:3'(2'), 5'-bisphosphate nucleotidase|uniref:3'(2'),5'-bisphosphate nucleotidase CysQ n=1 Tax=Gordonia pseudamarae TaxID=2831662 RepID=A0ABX6IF10_9ACTN|nr:MULTISPECIES: 3'(2'),5'-bisphosphate nucleotidase CysQ [Gordonia]MBD0024550.1 3'(2'),5'-bisphosphate nucleotidase CysQ [Gordonia sp. (in: high G+C Gram-positive bacteria)]QHN25493.1 3'(2'),5'-bisphosphate nucleotidase CysQ [Gordonia pseudamarae]QHN34425.1 3'(2'),5'-bisphosphate nucleotidase CysQ [Gordonia pseudamarae]
MHSASSSSDPRYPGSGLSDAELAARIARGAGEILLGVRHGELLTARHLGDVGDTMAQAWIAAVLARHRPADAVLSEEAADVGDRATADRVWIIDPLDGTRQFAAGSDEWAVHVALTENGKVTQAAVSLPARGQVFRSDTVAPADGPLTGRLATSRYASYEVSWVSRELGLRPVLIGSAGAKAMAVVSGEADAYVHAGGQYEWDNCAPVGVALAAGLHCSRLDGTPIVYNQPYPYMPDFVICRGELREQMLASLAEIW